MTVLIDVNEVETMDKAIQYIKNYNFTCTIPTYALLCPIQYTGTLLPILKKYKQLYNTNKYMKLKHVLDHTNSTNKLILLDQGKSSINSLHTDVQQLITQYNTTIQSSATINQPIDVIPYDVNITYDNLTAEQVLARLLPSNLPIQTSFESIGHIAHININNNLLLYKYIVGVVILHKNQPTITTVVNKIGTISNEYRVYESELLAGVPNYIVQLKEHYIQYKLDITQVYWNSKLSTEHVRITDMFKSKDVVLDMCCGIGPFVLPALKKHCTVYANDLNPHSIYWLNQNIVLNKLHNPNQYDYIVENMDGKQFVHKMIQYQLSQSTTQPIHHILMNLPALSISFNDVFIGMYNIHMTDQQQHIIQSAMPIAHCHCFADSNNYTSDVLTRLQSILQYQFTTIKHTALGVVNTQYIDPVYNGMNEGTVVIHNVRNVSPNKDMLCVSYRIPIEVAFRNTTIHDSVVNKEHTQKKSRIT